MIPRSLIAADRRHHTCLRDASERYRPLGRPAINLRVNIDGCGVVAPPVHSSLRAPHLLANLLAHNLPLPRAAH